MALSRSPLSEDSFSGGSSPPVSSLLPLEINEGAPPRKRERAKALSPPPVLGDRGSEEEFGLNESERERAKRQRKEQRMHRNRQSAARSRKRKEDRLARLSEENQSLRDEVELLKSQLAAATSKGFAAVKTSNFIVLMKLAAMFLIIDAISVAVAVTLIECFAAVLLKITNNNHPTQSLPSLLRPAKTKPLTVPRFTAGFATAVMPFALPATPVR